MKKSICQGSWKADDHGLSQPQDLGRPGGRCSSLWRSGMLESNVASIAENSLASIDADANGKDGGEKIAKHD